MVSAITDIGDIVKELIGKTFGKWTILEFLGRDRKSEQIYSCLCLCGNIKNHRLSILKSGITTQCKSCWMSEFNKRENLIGKIFGEWTVASKALNTKRNEWFYNCICSCGLVESMAAHRLTSGNSTKCYRCRNKTHGMSNTATFRIWAGILRRCFNNNFKFFHRYGGRGITICDRWLKFENFLEDMGVRPAMLQIDRIDNDGNYEPGNCRWVTSAVNNSNRNIKRKK